MMRLAEIASLLGVASPPADAELRAISTDSRSVGRGELFIAIIGERFDGHDFLAEVAARGAVAAVVAADRIPSVPPLPLLAVSDTRRAYGDIAAAWRQRFGLPVIGVVGSNGKTTAKEICASILAAEFGADRVLATTGNLNNDIGLPAMVLRLTDAHHAAVFEIGMNHPGETALLAPVAAPGIALINNAQREHQEFMKSVEAVAEEHALLIDALGAQGIAVFNADDLHAPLWRQRAGSRSVLDFGVRHGAVRAQFTPHAFGAAVTLETPWGHIESALHVPGAHNVLNACGAAAACLAAGVSTAAVAKGIAAFSGVKGRLQRRPAPPGVLLIDDSYNANPDSMRAALEVLAATPGRRVFVMGDMGEVGDQAAQMHDEIGGYAKSHGIDRLLCLGDHARAAAANFGPGADHFNSVEALLKALDPELNAPVTILVKGSRFMRMERVSDAIAAKGIHHAA
jgi:UDP-N-acetylmuramoyl-tripeptide--D-alanyl-D-alanine ligase